MDFSKALIKLKQGKKLKRIGWNGKKQFVKHYKSDNFDCRCEAFIIINEVTNISGFWCPSVSDLFAEDWEIYKGE